MPVVLTVMVTATRQTWILLSKRTIMRLALIYFAFVAIWVYYMTQVNPVTLPKVFNIKEYLSVFSTSNLAPARSTHGPVRAKPNISTPVGQLQLPKHQITPSPKTFLDSTKRNIEVKLFNIKEHQFVFPTSTHAPAPPKHQITKFPKAFLDSTKRFAMTTSEAFVLLKTISVFDIFWRQQLKRDYFLNWGSLLGAYRHAGFVPYDDDIDIAVPVQHFHDFETVFANHSLQAIRPRLTSKFYRVFLRNKTLTAPVRRWRWPYLDTLFYEVPNNTIRILEDRAAKGPFKFAKSEVLPLIYLPFESLYLPAPRCTEKIVKFMFDSVDWCCMSGRSHKKERSKHSICIYCQRLNNVYPLAKLTRINETHCHQVVSYPGPIMKSYKERDIMLPKCR